MPGLPNIFDVPFGEETTWFVSHVDEGSGLFYVQHGNPSVTAKYERLFCTIEQDASEGALRRLESPKIGKLCLAQYSVDEQWYRARILSCNGEVVEVIFLDYGNSEQTLKDSLCELPEEYKVLPAQCCQANLNCFAPIPGNHWTKEAIQLLKELVLDKELRGKAIRLSKNGTLHMSLFADNANKVKVSEQLVAAGYGRSLPPTSSRSNSSSSLSSLSSCDTGKGNPNVTQHYALQELDTEDYHDLCISHYESLDSFYCQLEKISSKLEQLTCKLNTYYNSLSPDELVLQEPLKGMPCCALYFEDQIWYRGIITNTDFLDRGTVTVSFIDFGNTDETPVKHVKCIKPEFMDLPAQGIQCGLLGIKPPQNLGDYSHAAMEVFEKMTSDKHLIGLASGKREGPKYLIILYDTTSGKEEVNINDELVKAGVAWKAEAKDASTSSSEENTSACEKTLLSSPAITLDIGRTVVGYVAYTLDPHEFYFQLSKDTELLEDIMEKLDSLYSSQEHGTRTNISVGSVCCCRYQEDGKFYRAQVVSYSEATAKVIYIDYGNAEDASIADLFPLSKEFLQYPGLAIKCKLDGVAPINGLFDAQAKEEFEHAVIDKELKMEVVDITSDHVHVVNLSKEGNGSIVPCIDIKDILLQTGFVSEGPSVMQKVSHGLPILRRKDYVAITLDLCTYIGVVPTIVVSPSSFCCQLICNTREIDSLMEELHLCYTGSQPNANISWQKGIPCAALYEGDGGWYRAVVEKAKGNLAGIKYVDFGNKEIVETSSLRPLYEDFFELPAQAIPCTLECAVSHTAEWSLEAVTYFKEVCLEKQLIMFPVSQSSQNCYSVRLYDTLSKKGEHIDFEELLCSKGFLAAPFSIATTDSIEVNSLKLGKSEEVIVTAVESPYSFWCQIVGSLGLDELMDSIATTYEDGRDRLRLEKAEEGQLVCCQFTEDDGWYRARVLGTKGDKVTVCYIDYGNTETLPLDRIRMLASEFSADPSYAVHCALKNPSDGRKWNAEEQDLFRDMTLDHQFTAKLINCDNELHVISLYKEGSDISKALTKNAKKLAQFAQKFSEPEDPEINSTMDVLITYMESATTFYCQPVHNEQAANQMLEKLSEYAPQAHTLTDPKEGSICIAKFSVDDMWYRAVVRTVLQDSVRVQFVDYGNEDEVSRKDLKEVDASLLSCPKLSLYCFVKGLDGEELFEEKTYSVKITGKDCNSFEMELTISSPSPSKEVLGFASNKVYKMIEINESEDYKVYISHINSLSDFYVQLVSCNVTLDELATTLEEISNQSMNVLTQVQVDTPCICQYDEDNSWYRGKVIDINNALVTVLFVDYGNTTRIEVGNLYDIPGSLLGIPAQSIHCMLDKQANILMDDSFREKFLSLDNIELNVTFLHKQDSVWNVTLTNTELLLQSSIDFLDNGKETLISQEVPKFKSAVVDSTQDCQVFVSHVNSLSDFYVQKSSSTSDLDRISDLLSKICISDGSHLPVIGSGVPCLCAYEDDGLLYRAEVQAVAGDRATVLFVDYGNAATVNVTELREIPIHLLTDSRMAIQCRLEGLVTDDQDKGKIADFHSLVDDVELTATFVTQVEDIWDVNLEGETGCIREALFAFNEGTVEESSYFDAAIIVESDAGEEVDKEDEENFEDETVMETDVTHQVCFEEDENFADEMIMNTDIAEEVDIADVKNFEGDAVMEIGVEGKVCFEEEENLVGDASDQRASEFSLVSNAKCLATAPLAEGTSHVVYVSHVNSITDFYVQLSSSTGTLEDLESELAKHCGDSLAALTEVQVGCCCVCKFVEDGLWHRAEVQEVSGQTVKVLFVDYGNSSTVDASELREISDHLLSESRLAIHCRLEGLTTDDQDEGKIADFHSLVDDVELTATFLTQVEDIWNVSLEGFVGCLRGYLFETASEDVKAEDVKATPKSYGIKAEVRGKHDVVISNILCNGWLYLNLKSDLDTISEISNALGSALDREKFPLSPVIVGMPCCIFFESTKKWVRGRVHELHASTVVTVMAVDTGVTQEFASSAIFALPDEFLEVTPLALPCCFAGNECMRGNLKASSGLRYLIERKVLLTADFLCVDKNVYQVRTFLQEQLYDPALLKTCMDFRSSLDFMAHTNELLQDLKPKREALLKVQIASISHPDDFVCHPSQCVTVLENITSLLLSFVDSKPLCRGKVDRDSVIAFDQVYSKWARGQVLNFGKARALVSFIDLGHQAWIEYSALRLLPFEFLEIPKLALTCKLHNLKPCSRTWTNGAIDYLKSLSRSKKWFTCMIHNDQGGKLEVDLITEDDVNVGSKLVELGLALRDAAEIKNRPEDEEKPPGHYFGVSEDSLSQASFIVCKAFDTVANIKGVISSVFAVDDIWIQPTENKTKLDDIATAITNHSQKFEELSIEPAENLPCLAFSAGDNQWYRAKIEAVVNDSVTALLVDVGEKMDVKIFNLRPIPTELFAIPPLCFRVALHAPLLEPEILTDILHYIQSVHVGQEVDIELESRSDHYFSVKLFWNGRDIVDSFFANRISLHGGAAAEILTVPDEEVDISSEVVFLSHLNSLDDLFFQRVSDTDRLETLTRDLNTLPESSLNFLERITSGTHCLAPVGDGGSFCRVEVTDVVGDVASVHLLDYGKDREVNRTCLRPLPPTFFSQPKCCIHCKLVGWEEKLEDTEAYRLWLLNNANNYELKLSSVGMQGNKRVVHLFCNGDPFTEVFMRSQRVDHVVNEKGFSKNGARFVDHDILTDIITPVRVLSVNDDLSFTCELVEMTDPLKTLVDQIQDHCDNDLTEKIEWVQDTPCLALFPECSLWHRAIVNECKGDFASVYFVDCGKKCSVPVAYLRHIPSKFTYLACASIHCTFDVDLNNIDTESGLAWFTEKCLDQNGTLNVVTKDENRFVVRLYVGKEDIAESLRSKFLKDPEAQVTEERARKFETRQAVCEEEQQFITEPTGVLSGKNDPASKEENSDMSVVTLDCSLKQSDENKDPCVDSKINGDISTVRNAIICGSEAAGELSEITESIVEDDAITERPAVTELAGQPSCSEDRIIPRTNSSAKFLPASKEPGYKLTAPLSCSMSRDTSSDEAGAFAKVFKRPFHSGESIDLKISVVISPSNFWCQFVDTQDDLDGMTKAIADYCQNGKALFLAEEARIGFHYLAPFIEENKWYRCEVVKMTDDCKDVFVRYVDFGHCAQLPLEKLKLLPPNFCKLPAQALSCSLFGISGSENGSWSFQAISRFEELCGNNNLNCIIMRVRESTEVLVEGQKESVNDTLVLEGFAVVDEDDE